MESSAMMPTRRFTSASVMLAAARWSGAAVWAESGALARRRTNTLMAGRGELGRSLSETPPAQRRDARCRYGARSSDILAGAVTIARRWAALLARSSRHPGQVVAGGVGVPEHETGAEMERALGNHVPA